MSFNNGNERRKLNAKWEHLRVQYREAGMSEDAIQAIEQAFSKTTQHQKLGAAFKHLQNGGGCHSSAC